MENIKITDLINHVHLENIGKNDSPSVFVSTSTYKILHLRLLLLNSNLLEYTSYSFLMLNKKIYSVSSQYEVVKVEGQLEELYCKVNNQVEYLTSIIKEHVSAIESLEDRIFERTKLRNIVNEIFEHKKNLLRIFRVLDRLKVVLDEFILDEEESITSLNQEFSDLVDDTSIGCRLVKAQIDKLDDIYKYYTSIKNDNLNKNIYILSIISGIFLPLNLIVGFFGMNTSGLFLSGRSNGSEIIFYSIIAIFAFMVLGLPLLHFIDKFLMSKLFGRYVFYSRVSKKIESLNGDFNLLDTK